MLGSIVGDVVGSRFEANPIKAKEFDLLSSVCRFTDDTVLTVAVAEAILKGRDYAARMEDYYYHYPTVPYGARFHDWASGRDHEPYGSWGNGAAMRVGPVVYACHDRETLLAEARTTAEVTHNHPEGVRGAQAVALAAWMARYGAAKAQIRDAVTQAFGYDLSRRLDDIRPTYACDLSCQHTVPEALICFLESEGFEDAIRNAVSLGGDPDTMACITGTVAEPYYGGVPSDIAEDVVSFLDDRLLDVLRRFSAQFGLPSPLGGEGEP